MNHMSVLRKYDFDLAGHISLDSNDDPVFDLAHHKFKCRTPQIYAWTVNEDVVYIGMASKGIKKRLGEHKQGWRGGSATGVAKAQLIRSAIQATGEPVKVYGRTCDSFSHTVSVLGESQTIDISLIDREEDALLKMLRPAWNVNGK